MSCSTNYPPTLSSFPRSWMQWSLVTVWSTVLPPVACCTHDTMNRSCHALLAAPELSTCSALGKRCTCLSLESSHINAEHHNRTHHSCTDFNVSIWLWITISVHYIKQASHIQLSVIKSHDSYSLGHQTFRGKLAESRGWHEWLGDSDQMQMINKWMYI